MGAMFFKSINFNQELNFDTSSVTNMEYMFANAKSFNRPLNFDISNVTYMSKIFNGAEAFLDKYNNGNSLPYYTEDIKLWLEKNSEKMNIIDIKDTHGKEIDDFFTDIYSMNRIGFHKI